MRELQKWLAVGVVMGMMFVGTSQALAADEAVQAGYGETGEASAGDEEGAQVSASVTFGATYTDVDGDEQKFREDLQFSDRLTGGLESLEFFVPLGDGDWAFSGSGRAAHRGDYGAILELSKPGLGFFEVDYDESPSFYDSSNLFYPFAPFVYELDTDPETRRLTTGGTLGWRPLDGPAVTVRYEHWEKDGKASTLIGGDVTDGDAVYLRYPVLRDEDQKRDTVSFQVDHTIGNFDVSVATKWQDFRGRNSFVEKRFDDIGELSQFRETEYTPDLGSWTSTLDVTGDILEDVLRMEVSGYFRIAETDSNFDYDAFDPEGNPTGEDRAHSYFDNKHEGDIAEGVLNLRMVYTPFDTLAVFGGVGRKDSQADHRSQQNDLTLTSLSSPCLSSTRHSSFEPRMTGTLPRCRG